MKSDKLTEIINSHPLAPLFVLSAVLEYSKKIADTQPSDYSPLGLVHPESWIELGKEIQQQLTN
jgi:hypothetical protein